MRFPVSLRSDAPVQIRLALSAADSGEQATEGALRLLRMRGGEAADGLERIEDVSIDGRRDSKGI